MRTYRVRWSEIATFTALVEADDEEDAIEQVNGFNTSEPVPVGGEPEISNIEVELEDE